MAIGFPVKANYASGDILTAAQMNDLSGTLNYMDPTAKGDLFPASSGTALTRLAVGNNGETLVADSSTSTGLRYSSSIAAGKNVLINGNFDFWQRGTSFTTTGAGAYYADRWQNGAVYGTNTITRQTTGVPVGSTYCFRFTGTMAGTLLPIQQLIESTNVKPLVGKTATFSVKLRRNAAFDQNIIIAIDKSSTVDAAYSSTWTNISSTTITNANLPTGTGASDWVTATVTATIPSDGTANSLKVRIDHSATVATNGYYEVAQAMLELGSVATSFQINGATIQGELAACQRYYYRTGVGAGNTTPQAYEPLGYGSFTSTTNFQGQVEFPVSMRIATGAVEFSNVGFNDASSVIAATNVLVNQGGTKTSNLTMTVASGGTQFRFARIINNNNTAGYLGWSAEL
jgi:hypothetical protein